MALRPDRPHARAGLGGLELGFSMRLLFRPARASLTLTLTCLTLVLFPGCSGSKKLNLAPVSGTVKVGGAPLTSGQITFVPASKEQEGTLAAGTIGADGTYTISSGGKSGAPLGNYKITITPSMVPTGDGKPPTVPFNTKYQSVATTPLAKEVIANPEAGRYDFNLDK
jgi:hypothetical protein